ncbi:YgiW/YdeI family stress tolerance OB fold protein [Pectobacterium versatile]|uniref:YgiW/YdeI family stress tolerance OB fold protein n=1 Tax=Pectobacterium versatile TaxID=2488639 RepID=UPI000DE6C460|nr:NirD/YgiW/YdeI family stress tolerance protein [Pectobacterium versatile]GKV82192.1 outer membrane protein [Pectobacterium carotovorum subsp. carotovorum]MBN3061954.1 YgiW/YdeI family stress tolerance OB fold protein [Pectobacterium versatile]MCA5933251.1 YgiW/YdeI family stress tolerance OB fold protein [Pectobacterium versatile]MCA5950414.1 YgiW/YdeI family stress tolerance OB fold protein [Pectobacterium versatile]MCA5954730.1 YgiW/YdeI family stress tolerance OB fold protein [Pectobacte
MKKAAALLAITALVSAPVFAAQSGGGFVNPETPAVGTHQGGFIDQQSSLTTVDKAKDLRDDSWVTLSGNIEKRIGDENYLFRDATGTMEVEIDHKRWNGQMVSPSDKVEIQGELDKDFNSVELDVKQIRKL